MLGDRMARGREVAADQENAHLAIVALVSSAATHLEANRHEACTAVNMLLASCTLPRSGGAVRQRDADALRSTSALSRWTYSKEGVAILLNQLRAFAPCLLATNCKGIMLFARKHVLREAGLALEALPVLRVHGVLSEPISFARRCWRLAFSARSQVAFSAIAFSARMLAAFIARSCGTATLCTAMVVTALASEPGRASMSAAQQRWRLVVSTQHDFSTQHVERRRDGGDGDERWGRY